MLMSVMCKRQKEKEQKQERTCEKCAIFMSLWRNKSDH